MALETCEVFLFDKHPFLFRSDAFEIQSVKSVIPFLSSGFKIKRHHSRKLTLKSESNMRVISGCKCMVSLPSLCSILNC